eukprot:CAMPEP_0169191756 /NCGR_PEP_ID=MMETSP1016-20121227/5243_1 /TAXON_ID=342587 /ORGANISM="Karlodinium micrum, Strain CCMP2283" /LENGTH=46 /DNA_ID= /DNA_START= /DNA_END= /DNA_ORIENTATION=
MLISPSGTINPRWALNLGAFPKCGFNRPPGRIRKKPAPEPPILQSA